MSVTARGSSLLAVLYLCALAPMFGACDDSTKPPAPSTEAIAAAKSESREVTIGAPYSTTPVADDGDRDAPIVLHGRVFGRGPAGVVLAPMRLADQTAWFPFATRLAETGKFTVLTFDFRGFGDSTGEKEFDRVDTDLAAAYWYVRDQLGISRVFLVGASMGGTASLVMSARVPVAGVVSISSPVEFLVLDAVDAVPAISAPKLFIASKKDVPAERSEAQFWDVASDPKDRELYDGDAHGTDLLAGPNAQAVEAKIFAFLTAN